MNLAHLTDNELVRLAHCEIDELTNTPLELELLRRLTALVDNPPLPKAIAEVIETAGIDEDDLPAICEVLEAAGVSEVAALKKKLEQAAAFEDIANDAGDLFDRLNNLINTTA